MIAGASPVALVKNVSAVIASPSTATQIHSLLSHTASYRIAYGHLFVSPLGIIQRVEASHRLERDARKLYPES